MISEDFLIKITLVSSAGILSTFIEYLLDKIETFKFQEWSNALWIRKVIIYNLFILLFVGGSISISSAIIKILGTFFIIASIAVKKKYLNIVLLNIICYIVGILLIMITCGIGLYKIIDWYKNIGFNLEKENLLYNYINTINNFKINLIIAIILFPPIFIFLSKSKVELNKIMTRIGLSSNGFENRNVKIIFLNDGRIIEGRIIEHKINGEFYEFLLENEDKKVYFNVKKNEFIMEINEI